MEQELLYGPGLNPKRRVFGEWEPAFGCGGANACPSQGGFAAGECSGDGLGMNVGFGENSGNCGVGDPEKMSFMELLGLAASGAAIPAGATPAKNSGRIPDDNGISVPPTPMEKEQISRKTKVKTPRQPKVKRKKHRPKIFDESKPKRVPKSTPKRENGKRKYARRSSTGQPPGSPMRSEMVVETSLNPETPGSLVEGRKRKCTLKASKHPLKSCKRGINFDPSVEDDTDVETVNNTAEEQINKSGDCSIEFYANSSQYVDHKALELENKTANIYATSIISADTTSIISADTTSIISADTTSIISADTTSIISAENNLYEKRLTVGNNSVESLKPVQSSPNHGCKESMDVMNHNSGQTNTLQVYQRTFQVYRRKFRANEIIKNSRKLGPNCPKFAKKKRSKRRSANKYNFWLLEEGREQMVIAPKYALRSKKKYLDLDVNNSILPGLPKSQIKAAIADPKSFICLYSLFPLVKSERKRSKRFSQSNLSHSSVTHSDMGKKNSNLEFLCHALDSIPKGKRSKNLMRRQGLPSSSTITHNSPDNIKLEAPAEIPAYPPQWVVQPHGYDNFMEKDRRLLDTAIIPTESSHAKVELRFHPPYPRTSQSTSPQHHRTSHQHPRTSQSTSHQHPMTSQSISDITLFHPIAAVHPPPPRPGESLKEYLWSSNSKVEIRIHPPYPHPAPQRYLLPNAASTSGLQSKYKVEKHHLRHGTTMSKRNNMLSDIEFCRQDHFPIAQGSLGQLSKHLMEIIQKLQRLQISDEHGQLVVRDLNLHGAVIPFNNKFDGAIIPYNNKVEKKRKMPKVDLDPETLRRWNLLMETDASELPEDEDEKKKKDWEEQKEIFCNRLKEFITCMHVLQGDRRFSPWKGSVVDSVVGVFLTQNVSDYLSSNAFMSLAAKYGVTSTSCDIQVDSPCSQESTSNPTGPNNVQSHETFISSAEKEPGSLGNDRVVKHPPVNHDFCCSSPAKIHLPEEVDLVELPGFQSENGTRLCGCESGIITSSTERLEDMNGAPVPNGCTFNGAPVPNGCTFNLGFGCDCGEPVNRNCGSKSGCACEEMAKASANSNTLLNELEVAMEDNTVLLNNTLLEENTSSKSTEKKGKVTKMPKPDVDWEELRRTYYNSNRTPGTLLDSIDWNAVRCAPVGEVAKVIETRGMNNVLAEKIKAFLDRLVEDHGSIDLEWLKDVPPEKAKEFLLSIRGVGLKSTECVRLLTLGHHAFPVDTNIARIVVRLGWVPLEPLPGDLQIHLLEQYPQMDSIQKYLWPRLCTLDKNILYVLHYQLITFGKVICTKKNPNCNACPMRAECKHFASAFASSRLRLRGAPEKRGMSNSQPMLPHIPDIEDFPYKFKDSHIRQQPSALAIEIASQDTDPTRGLVRDIEDFPYELDNKYEILASQDADPTGGFVRDIEEFPYELDNKDEKSYTQTCEPIIEVPASLEPESQTCEPIIEVPASPEPEPESTVSLERDISNILHETEDDDDEIPHIKLDTEEFKRNLMTFLNPEFEDEEVSNALVALTPQDTTIPSPKIKSVERLRTRHRVYIVPDSHPLLIGFERRELDDPCPYLLAIWPQESLNVKESCSQDSLICSGDLDSAFQETNNQIVCGTILIPCRTANKGSFPLNGTYFQVNEVFADHESSVCPINIPRKWIWNLTQRYLYCGSTASAIARGMEMNEIQHCFWNGFVCVRAFDRQTRNPIHLSKRFHELPSVAGKKKVLNDD
ncbi:DNA glycosylase/AP lyase ROS1-like isoform X2 [Ipomoea triloba]|uniref:DNA glycosylase/AP lyase ROS1-like isoform X2 n=1 Tax=Ipomoea triloba TaxID=35885 RepID=UPI00125CFBE6|nr:DNA glycosylase/AP lyase ROS1-like isoform X2 [Ipomoea triloba]